MDMIRLRYTGGKSVNKLYFNRVRYVFNKDNNFTTDVPMGMWRLIKQTNRYFPMIVEKAEAVAETVEIPKEKPKDETICEVCGFKAKTRSGLLAHKRIKHKEA